MAEKKSQLKVFSIAIDDSQSETIQGTSQTTLDRAKSATSWKDPGPPPDGGVRAWTQVLMGHLVIMNTWYPSLSLSLFYKVFVL